MKAGAGGDDMDVNLEVFDTPEIRMVLRSDWSIHFRIRPVGWTYNK
jgi:hypothetical protein